MERHVCPPGHPHGENATCYCAHRCRCDRCREWNRDYRYWYRSRAGKPTPRSLVPATGTHRRLQALMFAGWSGPALREHLGCGEDVDRLLRRPLVTPARRDAVTAMFTELWDKEPPARDRWERLSVTRTQRWARARGFVSALAWDDIDHDVEPAVAERDKGRAGWVVDELDHLYRAGESAHSAAVALNRNPVGLSALAYDHKRPDLARWIEKAVAA